jgi:hypothetical protein
MLVMGVLMVGVLVLMVVGVLMIVVVGVLVFMVTGVLVIVRMLLVRRLFLEYLVAVVGGR